MLESRQLKVTKQEFNRRQNKPKRDIVDFTSSRGSLGFPRDRVMLTRSASSYTAAAASCDPPAEIQEWAAETMATWMEQVKSEWKQTQRRETLVRFRANKKQRAAHMRCERDQLEREVKRRLAALNATAIQRQNDREPESNASVAVCRLALESEALRTENLEMHQKLQQLKRLWSLVQEGLADENDPPLNHSLDMDLYKASQTSAYRRENEPGWRVYFPNGEPSFYFHPLTRDEFDAIYKAGVEKFTTTTQQVNAVETLFGWNVYHAPLTKGCTMVARAKFSMRVSFSVEDVDRLVLKSDLKWLPLIVVPPGWNDRQRNAVSTQVLQEFETDAYIVVCNIPGEVHLRYLQMIRRLPQKLLNGKRSMTYAMAVANSSANSRARVAEEPQTDVVWVGEGSNLLVVTEVDAKTVDLTFEFQASAQDELHARHLFVYWTQFVCRWSERIAPPRLIETGNANSR